MTVYIEIGKGLERAASWWRLAGNRKPSQVDVGDWKSLLLNGIGRTS
jgi:hypothetical protein